MPFDASLLTMSLSRHCQTLPFLFTKVERKKPLRKRLNKHAHMSGKALHETNGLPGCDQTVWVTAKRGAVAGVVMHR